MLKRGCGQIAPLKLCNEGCTLNGLGRRLPPIIAGRTGFAGETEHAVLGPLRGLLGNEQCSDRLVLDDQILNPAERRILGIDGNGSARTADTGQRLREMVDARQFGGLCLSRNVARDLSDAAQLWRRTGHDHAAARRGKNKAAAGRRIGNPVMSWRLCDCGRVVGLSSWCLIDDHRRSKEATQGIADAADCLRAHRVGAERRVGPEALIAAWSRRPKVGIGRLPIRDRAKSGRDAGIDSRRRRSGWCCRSCGPELLSACLCRWRTRRRWRAGAGSGGRAWGWWCRRRSRATRLPDAVRSQTSVERAHLHWLHGLECRRRNIKIAVELLRLATQFSFQNIPKIR